MSPAGKPIAMMFSVMYAKSRSNPPSCKEEHHIREMLADNSGSHNNQKANVLFWR
jgi:hypothetical protein